MARGYFVIDGKRGAVVADDDRLVCIQGHWYAGCDPALDTLARIAPSHKYSVEYDIGTVQCDVDHVFRPVYPVYVWGH